MNLKYFESYINGIFDLAKEQNKNLVFSETLAECYRKDTYKEDLYKEHKINLEKIELKEITKSKEKVLNDWFNNKKVVSALLSLLEYKLKEIKKIYRIKKPKEIDDLYKKNKPFYFVENLMIIEFEEYVIWLSLGTFE